MWAVGPGTGIDWHRGRDGDGVADGRVLPSRNDVCGTHEYVFGPAGRGAGPDRRDHVLCSARESMGGDTAWRSDRRAASWRDLRNRPSGCRASRGPAGSGAGVVGRVAGRGGLGFLLLGGSTFARLGLGCCGSVARNRGDGSVARTRGELSGLAGGDGDRCRTGRFDPHRRT